MSRLRSSLGVSVFILCSLAFFIGCSSLKMVDTSVAPGGSNKQGLVRGGSQPIAGATVQLYVVGTAGDGSASTALLATPATTDANGAFNITGQYSCPSASSLVYLVATGGNPGMAAGTNNPTLALMTALGACGNLSASTFIVTNELTTVAAVWALAPYMSSYSSIGSASGDAAALTSAFALASQYVNPSTGVAPGQNVPAGATVPVPLLNTLADILSVCVNSAGGVAGDGSPCGTLLRAATPPTGTVPANAIAAALNIANNPQANISTLFGLVNPISPFQPLLSAAPADFIVQLIVAGGGLSISPDSLTFPSSYVSFTSDPQTVTIANTSSKTIGLGSFGISGVNSSDFAEIGCGTYLVAGDTCTLSVTFTPSAAGPRNAALVINSTSANSPQLVPLTGSGIALSGTPLTLSPSSLTFTLAGVPQTVTVTNSSLAPVTIGKISMSSVGSQTNNCPQVLDAQSICSISVQVTALTYTNAQSGSLGITSSAGSSQSVGINVPIATAYFSAAPLNFGSWAVGVSSPYQTASAHVGSYYSPAPQLITSITGPDASDFSLQYESGGCVTNYQCVVDITFTPGGTGTRTATLVTNYGNIALSGTGLPPGPSFSANAETVTMGAPLGASGSANLILLNNGSTALNLSQTITGANAGNFSVTNGCGYLSTGGSCTLNLGCTPSALGTLTATLTVTDSLSGTSQSIPLACVKQAPAATSPVLSPSSFDFGNIEVGSQSSPSAISVTAFSGDPVTITNYFSSPPPTPFVLSTTSCSQTPCQFHITFQPTSLGIQNATFMVLDTITQQYSLLSLSGTGGVPIASLSTSSLTFAARNQGSISIPQTITLTNTGDASLTLTSVSFAGANPGDFLIESNTCGNAVAAGANCSIGVSFSPTASGSRSASLQIVSNAASSPDIVQLSGTGN